MAKQHLLSWTQPKSYSGESDFPFGVIDEVDMSGSADDVRGTLTRIVVSVIQLTDIACVHVKVTLYRA